MYVCMLLVCLYVHSACWRLIKERKFLWNSSAHYSNGYVYGYDYGYGVFILMPKVK